MAKTTLLRHWLTASWLTLALTSCGYQSHPGQDTTTSAPEAAVPTRPFPVDTLYSLLVAETAANRGQLDIALANYYQQAYKTRDIGVTRRATLLAGYLRADQAALDLAQLWADIEPDNPEPVYLAGQYLVQFQRLDLATQQSRRLLDLDAKTLFVPIAISPAATDPRYKDALQTEYSSLLEKHPDNIDLLLGHAALLESQGDYINSMTDVEKALAIDGKDLQVRLFEVEILYKGGRPDKAIKRMGEIVEDDPDNNRIRMEYAQMLTGQDLEKAREQFDYLAQRNSLEPDLLLARAIVNYRLNDLVQAKDLFEQLLFLKKHADSANFYLGEIAIASQQPGKALEHYRRVEGGNEYLSAEAKAFSLMVQQDHRLEGQQWLADQRQLHPDLALQLYMIEVDVLLKQKDAPRSMVALDEAIRKFPEQPALYFARYLLNEQLGNHAAAESDLRFVLARQPDNAAALNSLGYMLADNNQKLDEAYSLLKQAIALRPQDPAVLDSMGWVLFRMGQKEEAILRLKKSFELKPDDEVAAHLGEVLWSIGKQDEARAIWSQGIKLKPGSDIILSTRKRLNAS